ncbi:MAG: alpha/beta fold hydrolase [Desulfobulbaceae bacterium]|uniref:Alpha/beta fold hydrolase n=1 Tax=Candidatus Desulfobia pelagia TaxID=2841692 RepID=A0A8J6NAR5_9BACT|nr:alpha/beta fold hydrolase [Candidatus Desulfobia pelagia]
MGTTYYFLHGLESSSKGTKGRWFAKQYPNMIIPDFEGDLSHRLLSLEKHCGDRKNLVLVGSSFGGLMATVYAMAHESRCLRLILLAPALNFPEFSPPEKMISTPTRLIIGKDDAVTPPDKVLPLAQKTFQNLDVTICNDDHMLHRVFCELDWRNMLGEEGL